MRITQWLSVTGICSRREARRLIAQGRIKVNQQSIAQPVLISPHDQIMLDDQLIEPNSTFLYAIYNKPVGVDCNCKPDDPNSIINCLSLPQKLFPVGRIDKDSHGLMLLTNDGALCQTLLSPRFNHPKTYWVTVRPHFGKPAIDKDFITAMESGLVIDGKTTKPCVLQQVAENQFNITLTQGLNRQIRKMCRQLGYHVINLQRLSILNLNLDGLSQGEWRYLTEEELRQLKMELANAS